MSTIVLTLFCFFWTDSEWITALHRGSILAIVTFFHVNVDIVESSGKATDIFRPCFFLLGCTIELILPERSRSGCLKRQKKDIVALTRAHRPVTEINPLPRSHSSERERTRFAWPRNRASRFFFTPSLVFQSELFPWYETRVITRSVHLEQGWKPLWHLVRLTGSRCHGR